MPFMTLMVGVIAFDLPIDVVNSVMHTVPLGAGLLAAIVLPFRELVFEGYAIAVQLHQRNEFFFTSQDTRVDQRIGIHVLDVVQQFVIGIAHISTKFIAHIS